MSRKPLVLSQNPRVLSLSKDEPAPEVCAASVPGLRELALRQAQGERFGWSLGCRMGAVAKYCAWTQT